MLSWYSVTTQTMSWSILNQCSIGSQSMVSRVLIDTWWCVYKNYLTLKPKCPSSVTCKQANLFGYRHLFRYWEPAKRGKVFSPHSSCLLAVVAPGPNKWACLQATSSVDQMSTKVLIEGRSSINWGYGSSGNLMNAFNTHDPASLCINIAYIVSLSSSDWLSVFAVSLRFDWSPNLFALLAFLSKAS